MTTLRARSDRRLIRSAHRSERFVLVELEAPPATHKSERDPVNLAFVLDRSGSMAGDKIELAKRAVATAVDRLLPTDRFAVVCYDEQVDVVVEGTPASREAKTNALGRLREIGARGSTDLSGGWLRGAEQVALDLAEHGVNRVLLLTDGLANRGITDPAELTRHAQELRARGVTTTTFGVGADFDEVLLQSIADAGGGHFYFIENATQIEDHIASEVGELLQVVVREASLEITAPESLSIGALSPYPVERRGSRHFVLLGDLVAEQQLEVVLRVRLPYGPIGEGVGILVGASDADGTLAAAGATPISVGWEYSDDATNDRQPRDRTVDRAVGRLFAARARQEAIGLNRGGDFDAAAKRLRRVAERIATYASDDPELGALVKALRAEQQQWSRPQSPMLRKMAFASSGYAMRSRAPSGEATRRPSA
jgi:Ca-activated chloride channel family protein